MGETAGKEKVKKNFFKGLKAEFNKIIWPDKDSCCYRLLCSFGLNHCAPGPDHEIRS